MKKECFVILTLLFLGFICFSFTSFKGNQKANTDKKVFTTILNDSVSIDMYLVYNVNSDPLKYYANVITPVCEEGLCYIITLDIYWDLLGNFLSYEESAEDPLTKFDHEQLTSSDHIKLKEILSDKHSLLKNYNVEDLVDKTKTIASEAVLDAVASATYPPLKTAIVSGAVYSSYTLWHIVNGQVAHNIKEYTESILNDKLIKDMMRSDNFNQQFYALNKITDDDTKFVPEIINLISNGDSYVPYFAIDKLGDSIWKIPVHQKSLIKLLSKVDFKMQNEILNRLNTHTLYNSNQKVLISQLKILDINQQKKALKLIDKDSISYEILYELSKLLNTSDSTLSKSVYRILDAKGKEYKDISNKLKNYHLTN
ncbi:hypothetical protein [Aurantibacter sp.]|uniref:hypothetical protein n=1 Tax=Aurantibacter sp. TaxID=2807103 RepID=UPI00326329F7